MNIFTVKEKQLVWQIWEYKVEANSEEEALHKVMSGDATSLESNSTMKSYIENSYSDDFEFEIDRQN